MNYQNHAYALDVSGYTIVPAQVSAGDLEEMGAASSRAIDAVEKISATRKLKYTVREEYYRGVRCMYCWSDVFLRVLENEAMHAIASLLMERYRLWDLSTLSALPSPPEAQDGTLIWHQDFSGFHHGTQSPGHLWFLFCLDDLTPGNGATWIVPGSHRLSSRHEPGMVQYAYDSKGYHQEKKLGSEGYDVNRYPSAIQVCAKAGDMVVLDPTIIHKSGKNSTSAPRRLINVGINHADLQPLFDHWAVAGPKLQSTVGDRVKSLLGADRQPLETTWEGLPEGWQSASQ